MSETRRAALVLAAERLGVLNVDKFDNRLVLQKSIYLLQKVIGVNLGYHYSWYLRGPYCSAVAHDAFNGTQGETLKEIKAGYRLSKDMMEKLGRFEEKILASKPSSVDQATWLEILSSLHYLKTEDPFSGAQSETDAITKLLDAKPFLKTVHSTVLSKAWTILNEAAAA